MSKLMTLSSSQIKSSRTETETSASASLKLPKPDLQNITVLTRKLPNTPILPWNHYDSPGLEAELNREAPNSD
jgi:hypothetical protein